MATRPDPTTPISDQTSVPETKSGAKGFLTFASCLTAGAAAVSQCLDVLNQAAQTFETLKSSGLIDFIFGG